MEPIQDSDREGNSLSLLGRTACEQSAECLCEAKHVGTFHANRSRQMSRSGFAYERCDRSEQVRIARTETSTCKSKTSDRFEPEQIQDSDREGNSLSLLGRDVNEVDREGIINIKNTLSKNFKVSQMLNLKFYPPPRGGRLSTLSCLAGILPRGR